MQKLCILLLAVFIVSCGGSNNKTFDSTVNFETINVERNSRDTKADTTYKVSVTYSNPVDAPEYLTDSILRYTKILFASWFDVSGIFDLNTAVKKHMDEYFTQKEQNNIEALSNTFDLKITPDNSYQNKNVLSFSYNWAAYQGGAHGNYGKYCFMLNKQNGSRIMYKDLVKPETESEFLKVAEEEFRTQSGIKEGEAMPDLYKFKDNKFHLNDNFALTPNGLAFYYNPYEIAPFSAGLIEVILPYDRIKGYLNYIN